MKFKTKSKPWIRPQSAPIRATEGKYIWETWDRGAKGDFFFTPWLNAALEIAMQDVRYANVARVQFYLMRNAWGNWCSYAVHGPESMAMAVGGAEDRVMLDNLLFGLGGCPYCAKISGKEKGLPRGFRWHRGCVALAFARDAKRIGSVEEQQWAADIFAGRM